MVFIPEDFDRETILATKKAASGSFKIAPVTEFTQTQQDFNYVVYKYITTNSLIQVVGASGSGKSFVAFDLAFCIAAGIDWHGQPVKQGNVVIILGEGSYGVGQRFKALEKKYGCKAENIYLSRQPGALTESTNAALVAESISELNPSLIIVDTLARNFGSGDENSSRDMSLFVQNLDNYLLPLGSVALVHHCGHGSKERGRGSSALYAALDIEFRVNKQDDLITLTCTKNKDIPEPPKLAFKAKKQAIDWLDEDGDPITTLVLDRTEARHIVEKRHLNARNEAILNALLRAIDSHGVEPSPEIKNRFGGFGSLGLKKVVHVDHWRKEAYPIIDVDTTAANSHAKNTAFNRARTTLRKHHAQTMNDFWWPIN